MTEKFNTLNDAKALAKFAHFKQKDHAGFDYIEHPKRVLAAVQAQGAAPFVQMAAILHDVTEDTAFSPLILLELGFSPAVVRLVELLDRDHSKRVWLRQRDAVVSDPKAQWWTGTEYVPQSQIPTADEFYYYNIKENPDAKMVKLADIADNSQPWRTVYLPEDRQEHLRKKYHKARVLLGDKTVVPWMT